MTVEDVIGEALRLAGAAGILSWWAALAVVLVLALVIVAVRSGVLRFRTPDPENHSDSGPPMEPPSRWGENVQQHADPSDEEIRGG